jgi:hypothetical protein
MQGVVSMNRLDFESYRSMFLECMSKFKRWETSVCCGNKWLELGDDESRRQLLEAVSNELQESCGYGFEVNKRLLSVDGPVESVIIQTFHEFNTIYLLEKINEKIKARLNQADRFN